MSKPGPNRWRQEAPHPHQAILDPTGKFLLLPDLGADLIRIYALDGTSVKPVAPLEAAPGSGPRHAVFFKTTTGKTIMYVIHELTNNVVGYDVTYPADGASMAFAPLVNVSTHGEGEKAANGATAAEIILSVSSPFLSPLDMFGSR